jgi:hypothetical protein
MKIKLYLFPMVCGFFMLTACVEKNYYSETSDPTGKLVTDIPNKILSFQDARNLKPGSMLKLRLNRSGSEIKEYSVRFDGTSEMNAERLIFCTTIDKLVIGEGDSGSPLLTEDGEVVGALCYGFEFANNQFAARAIEDMLAIKADKVTLKSSKKSANLLKELGLVYFVNGMDKSVIERYKGKEKSNFYNNAHFFNGQRRSEKSASIMALDNTIPGNSIAVLIVEGDLYTMGAVGTLSYINENNKLFAFGHQFGAGTLSAPVKNAEMVTMINSDWMASKWAVPTARLIGSLTGDTETGVLIDPAVSPKVFIHSVVMNLSGTTAQDYGNQISVNHQIANFWNPIEDVSMTADISASIVYQKLLMIADRPLQAFCSLSVSFETLPVYVDTFTVSARYWFDSQIYYSLGDKIQLYFNNSDNGPDNITDFKLTLDISDYDVPKDPY